ncbi:MAG: DUF1919 domain-containing protein [Verrucomicrobiota bacterium]
MNQDITIISNNCIAGFLYQDFYLSYRSPTVGFQFTQDGFVDFCADYQKYLELPITPHPNPSEAEFQSLGGKTMDFPVGQLGDLTLYLQHYQSVAEADTAWKRRATRINSSKMLYIFMVYPDTANSIVRDFHSLPLKHRLNLSLNHQREEPECIPIYSGNQGWYDQDPATRMPYYWQYDYMSWIQNCLQDDLEPIEP